MRWKKIIKVVFWNIKLKNHMESFMFNNRGRNGNIIRISIISAGASAVSIIVQFLYRTLFLMILSKEYLGIEGLFTNILQVLSLAELGIGTVISYRLYTPIQEYNVKEVAALMGFYRKVYIIVAIVILIAGIILLPFLKLFIKDASEIPSDINFYFIYILYLIQSVSSYFFTYKQTILAADQKGDILALFMIGKVIVQTVIQIIILKITRNYQFMLIIAILIGIVWNWLLSLYISHKYSAVFDIQVRIDEENKRTVFKDMRAMLCHKIGGTALGATDNLVLSAFVGLGQLGIYSNYSLILTSLNKVLNQLLGNFTASLGNAFILMDDNELYEFYEKLLLVNHIIANVATICVYILINPFIRVWQNNDMTFEAKVVILITICFYLNAVRIINCSFTNACGLFEKDIIRPLIECIINAVISVLFTLKLGIIGVFLGTVISHLCTVWWREPYLLYKYIFKRKVEKYWYLFFKNLMFIILEVIIIKKNFEIVITNYFQWIVQGIITFCVVLIGNVVINYRLFIRIGKKITSYIFDTKETNGI